jgi:N-acetylglucosamine kinase
MIFSFDIGGTTIRGATVLSASDIGPVSRMPTPKADFEAFAEALRQMILASGTRPDHVAISLAGVIDPDTRLAICANIPCIHGRPIEDDLSVALDLPVTIGNDADCFTMAEARIGAGRSHRVVFGAILGTGVGGGLAIDGHLINVGGGFAGEWGHAPVAASRAGNPPVEIPVFRCGCGLERCIDSVGSARGLERLDAHFHGRELAAEQIIAAWETDDAQSQKTVNCFIDIVSGPLALVVNVTGATIVPVGGGLSQARGLLKQLDAAVRARILRKFDRQLVVPGICRAEPGIIGAALLAGSGT